MMTDIVYSADGTKIVYHRTGSGPSVLIVHGTLAPTALYEPIAESLSEHYQVVLVERRGYDVSGDGKRPATFAMQAMDIAAVLDALDEPSYVFGHSAGGLVTLHALAIAAYRIRAVALYEPPASLAGASMLPLLQKCRALVDAGRNADAVTTFLSSVSDPGSSVEGIGAVLQHRAGGLIEDLECLTAMSTEPDRFSSGELPIVLMSGSESDRYARESIALLQRELPVRDTVVFAGQGHHPNKPEPVAAALHDFFSSH